MGLDLYNLDAIPEDITQLTETQRKEYEWRKKRLGRITGSRFGDIFKGKGKNLELSNSKVAEAYLYDVVWERLLIDGNVPGGIERTAISSKSLEHGLEYEGPGILEYEQFTGNVVERNLYNAFLIGDSIGATPDGLVEKDNWKGNELPGIIEVKCPKRGGNHIMTLLTGKLYNDKHFYQIQGNLLTTGRAWCDFVCYDPDMPEGANIAVIRFERDEETIQQMERALAQAVEKVKQIQQEFLKRLKASEL